MTLMTLYGRTTEAIPLATAIGQCQPKLEKAIALLYTPARCYIALLTPEGLCKEAKGQVVNYESVFEARLFTQDYELRWLNHSGGLGQAVLLSENVIEADYLEKAVDDLPVIATVPQQYVLWGEGLSQAGTQTEPQTSAQNTENDWSTLATARIGRLSVPTTGVGAGKGACLESREYLAAAEFGNVAVVEERLLSLSVVDLPQKAVPV